MNTRPAASPDRCIQIFFCERICFDPQFFTQHLVVVQRQFSEIFLFQKSKKKSDIQQWVLCYWGGRKLCFNICNFYRQWFGRTEVFWSVCKSSSLFINLASVGRAGQTTIPQQTQSPVRCIQIFFCGRICFDPQFFIQHLVVVQRQFPEIFLFQKSKKKSDIQHGVLCYWGGRNQCFQQL